MQITDEFRVDVPVDQAWSVLRDVERIAPCMPGAQLQEVEGDEYRGIVKVKVGPITAQYKGVARIVEEDDAAHKMVIRAEGRDTRGQGNAAATVTATLAADGDATVVGIDTELQVTGKVAQFGRGVMADVSSKLLGQFVTCLHDNVLSGDASSPMDASAAPAPARAATSSPSSSSPGAAATGSGARTIDAQEAEAVDLARVAGGAVAKRAVPVAIGIAVVVGVVIWLLVR